MADALFEDKLSLWLAAISFQRLCDNTDLNLKIDAVGK